MADQDIRAHAFRDLLCQHFARAIRSDPSLLDAARDIIDGPTYRSDYATDWRRLIDAGPDACIRHPRKRTARGATAQV